MSASQRRIISVVPLVVLILVVCVSLWKRDPSVGKETGLSPRMGTMELPKLHTPFPPEVEAPAKPAK